MRLTYAFCSSLAMMMLFGGFDMVRGVAGPAMQHDWHLSYLQLGDLFMASSIGYLAGSFIAGWFVVRLGTRRSMLAGILGLAVGTIGVVAFTPYILVILSFIVTGLANGCLEIAVNQVVPEMTDSPAAEARYFNALHGFYGVGSFIYPVIAAALISASGSWRTAYQLLLGLLCVLMQCIWWWPSERRRKEKQNRAMQPDMPATDTQAPSMAATDTRTPDMAAAALNDGKRASAKLPWLALGILMIALLSYTMAEVTVGTWLPTYLVKVRHYTVLTSSYALSGFYGLFTIGRLTAPLWVHRIGRGLSVGVSAGVAFVLSTIALFSSNGPWVLILFCFAGIGFAAVFPTITAMASAMDTARSGRVLGILFTVAGFASLFVNGLVGALATAYSLAVGFSIISVLLALVFIGIVLFSVLELRGKKSQIQAEALHFEGGTK